LPIGLAALCFSVLIAERCEWLTIEPWFQSRRAPRPVTSTDAVVDGHLPADTFTRNTR